MAVLISVPSWLAPLPAPMTEAEWWDATVCANAWTLAIVGAAIVIGFSLGWWWEARAAADSQGRA